MEIIVLGSGTSQGVPMVGCHCPVCVSEDPRDRRTRASIHVVMDGLHVQVDAAPEFRLQCLRERIEKMDLFILTHGHSDHVVGMDDLRRFCDMRGGEAMDVYSTDVGLARVKAIFPYAVMDKAVVRGYPAFRLLPMPRRLEFAQGTIESTLLPHGSAQTLGLVFTEKSSGKRFAYYTDCKSVTAEALALGKGVDAAILDGLRPEPHPSHMSIDEAIDAGMQLNSPDVWLTHLTHLSSHSLDGARLPKGFGFAFDGMRITL